MEIDSIIKYIVGISTFVGAIFAIRKLYKWLRPIRIEPSFTLNADNSKPDEICATITNRSSEPQYITECYARGINSLRYIVGRHIRNPLLRPMLYPNVWYSGPVYNLMEGEAIKVEPFQPIELRWQMYDHLLNALYAQHFLVKVELSSGRTIRSNKLPVPARWRLLGRSMITKKPA